MQVRFRREAASDLESAATWYGPQREGLEVSSWQKSTSLSNSFANARTPFPWLHGRFAGASFAASRTLCTTVSETRSSTYCLSAHEALAVDLAVAAVSATVAKSTPGRRCHLTSDSC